MEALSEDDLKAIQLAAEAMMTDEELCIICELEIDEFKELMQCKEGQIYEVVTRARLTKEAAVRKSIMDCAIQGSSPAQAMALKLIEQQKLNQY
jgi:hypothetical protein